LPRGKRGEGKHTTWQKKKGRVYGERWASTWEKNADLGEEGKGEPVLSLKSKIVFLLWLKEEESGSWERGTARKNDWKESCGSEKDKESPRSARAKGRLGKKKKEIDEGKKKKEKTSSR